MGVAVKRYMYIDILTILIFPTPLILVLFLAAASLQSFSFLFMLFLCNIANVAQRTFEIVQKLKPCKYNNYY